MKLPTRENKFGRVLGSVLLSAHLLVLGRLRFRIYNVRYIYVVRSSSKVS